MRSVFVVLVLLWAVSRAAAQPGPDRKIDAATRSQVIERALATLTKYYVFPDVAAKISVEIRKRVTAKKYDRLTSGQAFAEVLTEDLRVVNHDKHIGVEFSAEPFPDRKPARSRSPAEDARLREEMAFWNAGYVKAERLDGNVGYLRLDSFAPVDEAAPRAAAAMTLLADTSALIIDLRFNGGGYPASVTLLVSYLFSAREELHIDDIYSRADDSTQQYWTAIDLSGKRYPDKPVYVLTSARTFSAAEAFAYDVQSLKRGTVVGEVTGGGAHPSRAEKLHANFLLIVPNARAINAVTKSNWEGTGVRPDVVSSADRALDVAYLAALGKVKAAIDPRKQPDMTEELDRAIARLKPATK